MGSLCCGNAQVSRRCMPATTYRLSCYSRNKHPMDPSNYMCLRERDDHYVVCYLLDSSPG